MNPYTDIEQEPQKKFRLSRLLLALAVIGLLIWLFTGSSKEEAKKAPIVPVKVVNVKRQDVPYYLSGVGTIESPHSAEIRSRIDGELTAIYFTEGQDVKKGALLAEIDSRSIRAELAQARAERARANAELQTAKLDAQRYNNLLKADAIAKQTADQQTAKVKQLQATWLSASAAIEANEVMLSYTKITSPVSGRVGIRRVDAGNIVKASDANGIVKVTQVQPINAIYSLSQSELPLVQQAINSGEVIVDAMQKDGGTIIATGKLQALDNEIDNASGTIRLRAVFENKNNELWPGQLVVLRTQAGIHKDAKVIPVQAIQRGRESNFVYIVKDNTAQPVDVEIEYENSEIAVIKNGITFEDQIITDGQSRLKPGSKVKIPEAKPATNINDRKQ